MNYFTIGDTVNLGEGLFSADLQTRGVLDREAIEGSNYVFILEVFSNIHRINVCRMAQDISWNKQTKILGKVERSMFLLTGTLCFSRKIQN